MEFDRKYFREVRFGKGEVKRFLQGAHRDLQIAQENSRPEVKFNFSYTALFKAAQALIAAIGGVRIRSIRGHHIKVLDKLSEILEDESIYEIGDRMRRKRNSDLYGGGIFITAKESGEYCDFVRSVIEQVEKVILENL